MQQLGWLSRIFRSALVAVQVEYRWQWHVLNRPFAHVRLITSDKTRIAAQGCLSEERKSWRKVRASCVLDQPYVRYRSMDMPMDPSCDNRSAEDRSLRIKGLLSGCQGLLKVWVPDAWACIM